MQRLRGSGILRPMIAHDPNENVESGEAEAPSPADDTPSGESQRPKEIGGRGGLDPTRYGDWEKAGRCIDF